MAIEKSNRRNRMEPEIMTGIEGLSGQHFERALQQSDLALEELKQDRLPSAMDRLDKTLALLEGQDGGPDADALFVSTALVLSNLRLRLGQKLGDVPQLLKRARVMAERLGDRRSRALIDLHQGRFSYVMDNLSDALNGLSAGLDEVEDLGDEDIVSQSAEFVGLYYFLQGMYRDAARHFQRALITAKTGRGTADTFFVSYTYGYCTAFLAQFHEAIGVLDHNWRLYRKKGERVPENLFRSALGIVFLMMGKKDDALYHLQESLKDSRENRNPQPMLLAQVGLAYHHFLQGRVEESARIMVEGVIEAARANLVVRQYIFPFILEQLCEYRKFDSEFRPAAFDIAVEMERVISGPNIHLRGVAHRIRAGEGLKKGDNPAAVKSDLEASERYLRRSGDPIELAKTKVQSALFELKKGDRERAVRQANEAWKILSLQGGRFFPDELKSIAEPIPAAALSQESQAPLLERFLDVMEDFVPTADLDTLFSRLVAATTRFYRAERGALFWFDEPKTRQRPLLKAACNLSALELEETSFRISLELVTRSFRNNQPFIVPHGADEPSDRAILCVPFTIRGRVQGVLYYDSDYTEGGFDFLGRETLQKVARHMGIYIERICEYARLADMRSLQLGEQSSRREAADQASITADSPVMLQLLAAADRVADSAATVLILGETGVGKELLARRIHQMSRRSEGPFIVIDLSAIPENLVESELFGHERGAFTGADRQKLGRIELADRGTLFIDEVGEIPLALQTKLLRVLQDKSFMRIGGSRSMHPDFRLIAATNRDLERDVARGRFREDLFYRLNVVPIEVPPLRARSGDVLLLARHFLSHYARKHSRGNLRLAPDDEAALSSYPWPGNVRELQNVIERAVLLAGGDRLELNMPGGMKAAAVDSQADTPTMEEWERRYIRSVIEKTGGRIGGPDGAAKRLGLKRTTLYSRMKKLGLPRKER